MGLLTAFRKPAQPERPARDALRSHLARRVELQQTIDARTALEAPLSEALTRLSGLGKRIDAITQDEARRGTTDPAKAALQAQYTATETEVARLRGLDNGVSLKDLYFQKRAHEALTDELIHAAAIEDLNELAGEFLAAENAFREIHRKVFARVGLIDKKASALGTGRRYGYRGYGSLFISRPLNPNDPLTQHPAFARGPMDHWQAGLARDAELFSMDAAVDAYELQLKDGSKA